MATNPGQTPYGPYQPVAMTPQQTPYQNIVGTQSCYNCGHNSHVAQFCPEPRRPNPALVILSIQTRISERVLMNTVEQ